MCLSWITSLTYHICHISASWVLSTHRVRRYSTEVTLIVASWDDGSWWGKSGQHAPKYYSFGIMTVCVCSESVGKSPIPRARPAAARCVATRLSNTNVFWRHSELRQRQGFPTRHLSCSSTQSSISASECICLCFGNLNLIKHNISTEKLLMSAELLVTWLH